MIVRLAIAIAAGLLLGSCQTTGVGSVAGGECKIFENPQYVVLGKRPYDQDWIDSQIEGGVGGCGWKRPKPRPVSFDAVAGQKVKVAAPVKKRGIIKRIKDRVVHPFTKPVEPVIESTPPPVVAAPAPPPPAPRDPVDELLQPSVIRKVN